MTLPNLPRQRFILWRRRMYLAEESDKIARTGPGLRSCRLPSYSHIANDKVIEFLQFVFFLLAL